MKKNLPMIYVKSQCNDDEQVEEGIWNSHVIVEKEILKEKDVHGKRKVRDLLRRETCTVLQIVPHQFISSLYNSPFTLKIYDLLLCLLRIWIGV